MGGGLDIVLKKKPGVTFFKKKPGGILSREDLGELTATTHDLGERGRGYMRKELKGGYQIRKTTTRRGKKKEMGASGKMTCDI